MKKISPNLDIYFEDQNDYYYNKHGEEYDDLYDALQIEILKMCGCGKPEENVKYVRDGLKMIDKLKEVWYSDNYDFDSWKYECNQCFGNEFSVMFFFYVMDNLGLTEHGGSVPGWFTEMGEEFIEITEDL